jgi:predicted ArsR family transcriptional regulator
MTQEHQGALELGESHGLAHDAFQNGAGLGKNAHRVWLVMGRSPGSSSTVLADGLGIGLRTVRKHLRRLHGCGLTESDGNDHWFQTSRDLDQVAAELGTLGNADAQRARHGRERWAYEILRADRRGRETVRKSESM